MSDLPKKILHVDDDLALSALIAAVFEQFDGFDLKTATSGAEALECLADFAPDLILLDLSMPDMDGLEFLKVIVAKHNKIPVIFMTQYDKVAMQPDYAALGVIGVMHKPINPEQLLINIRDIWKKR